jgi:hypothetical protein
VFVVAYSETDLTAHHSLVSGKVRKSVGNLEPVRAVLPWTRAALPALTFPDQISTISLYPENSQSA